MFRKITCYRSLHIGRQCVSPYCAHSSCVKHNTAITVVVCRRIERSPETLMELAEYLHNDCAYPIGTMRTQEE